MEDKELAELIRRGAAGWLGRNGNAAGARFARRKQRTHWRAAGILAGAGAALLMVATAAAGGPGAALESLHLGPSHLGLDAQPAASESPSAQPTGEPTPVVGTEPTPAPKTEPTPAPKNEPTPAPKHEPTPPPKNEPSPTPKTEPSPTPQEGTPPPTG